MLMAFCSALFLGFYDVFKKIALTGNAVLPVLFMNTMICSLLFLPFILLSSLTDVLTGTAFYVPPSGWAQHGYIIVKSVIVLLSWVCGYVAMKHLPITIVGPVNATRPVLVLIGAMLVFGERLNAWQWAGVSLAVLSFYLLSVSSKKEGVDFRHNAWVVFLGLAALLGAVSGLYDRWLMAGEEHGGAGMDRMVVQSWYNVYQSLFMGLTLLVMWRRTTHKDASKFTWRWSILFISLFLSIADFIYFYTLTLPGVMISIVSLVRRSSVVVSFVCGALVFKEKNLTSKAVDLLLIILGMICLYLGL